MGLPTIPRSVSGGSQVAAQRARDAKEDRLQQDRKPFAFGKFCEGLFLRFRV